MKFKDRVGGELFKSSVQIDDVIGVPLHWAGDLHHYITQLTLLELTLLEKRYLM